ncbi:hypothetical protein HRI_001719400 [Hibiscus trionum]|uniref:MATH domain-containing protein n=1 Tax=Hibiscus trionum TaxID=183268 RepID=A0A9W7HNW0_HIBTR|nr:hypothetical protein HRI_001719400 [Hibiscus trionum]
MFGSNLPQSIWRVEILNGGVTKVTWRIKNFSSFKKDQRLFSENFIVDGNKWRILIFPKGNMSNVDHLSIYLDVALSAALFSGWSRFAQIGSAVIDQIDRKTSITKVTTMHECNMWESDWGFTSFLPLAELYNPKRGYLLNDACLVEAYISTVRTEALISHELILETDSDEHKAKAAIDNQTTTKTEPVEIKYPSPTQPTCQIVANEHGDPTEEDIKAFFTSLESELSSSVTVFSKQEAKEALAEVDEALNMTPLDFYDSVKFSSLEKEFKILSSFDCSSTTLTIEQKIELLAMEESLKELADRAVQDKSRLNEESIKLMITRNLDSSLIRYMEVELEVKQAEQKLTALLAERKGIFISSKETKMELEALGKECAEYEASAKSAEQEERNVEAKWGKMKDSISSIKGRI